MKPKTIESITPTILQAIPDLLRILFRLIKGLLN